MFRPTKKQDNLPVAQKDPETIDEFLICLRDSTKDKNVRLNIAYRFMTNQWAAGKELFQWNVREKLPEALPELHKLFLGATIDGFPICDYAALTNMLLCSIDSERFAEDYYFEKVVFLVKNFGVTTISIAEVLAVFTRRSPVSSIAERYELFQIILPYRVSKKASLEELLDWRDQMVCAKSGPVNSIIVHLLAIEEEIMARSLGVVVSLKK